MYHIRSNKTWQKYSPHRPRRALRSYHQIDRQRLYNKVRRIIIVLVVIFLLQSVFQIKYLAISNIELGGQKDLTLSYVQATLQPLLNERRWLFFKNNNFFLLRTKPLGEALRQTYNLEEVRVTKRWPHSIIVTVKEKISHFLWQRAGESYLLDANGAKIRPLGASESRYLVLEDRRSSVPESGALFSSSELDLLNRIYSSWQDVVGSQAGLYKISLGDNAHWDIYTLVGYYVKIDTASDIEVQLRNLVDILQAGNVAGTDIDYIDLRFGNKVFFR